MQTPQQINHNNIRILLDSSDWNSALYANEIETITQQSELHQTAWFQQLDTIFSDDYDTESFDLLFNSLDISSIPFVPFMMPFLKHSFAVANEKIYSLELDANSKHAILSSILLNHMQAIIQLAGKTLIFELNKSRLLEQLSGHTSSERYIDFINQNFRSKELILSFLSNYPLLARLICERLTKIINLISVSTHRLLSDASNIQQTMGIKMNYISNLTLMGDLHNGGQSVILYTFANKEKLIYKPHSLSIDVQFQKLLEWFNSKSIYRPLQKINIINNNSYGWVEFISQKECIHINEVNHFYERQGQYLAILYMLNATDMHYENIIAQGEHPILIDLEALFHNNTIFSHLDNATTRALKSLNESVMRTSLLPISIRNVNDMKLDISGLGSQQNQSMYAYQFADAFTDTMRIQKCLISVEKKNNHPLFEGILFDDATTFIDDIKKGFFNAYHIVLQHIDQLLSEDGPLHGFKSTTIRNIVRDTQTYSSMLDAGRHPKYLKNAKDREKLFNIMWKAADRFPILAKVIDSEIKDLIHEDVPYFWSIPDSSVMYDSKNKEINQFYDHSSYSLVLNTLNKWSAEDCRVQLNHIDYALSTVKKIHKLTEDNEHELTPSTIQHAIPTLYTKDDYLAEAIRIGESLLEEAVWGKDNKDITWVSLGVNQYEQIEYKPMELGLYDGLIGMCIFYAVLGNESKNEHFTHVARACLRSVLDEYSDEQQQKASSSAFLGYASIIYAINHLYSLWHETELLDQGCKIIDRLFKRVKHDFMYDFLGGSAGIISVILDFYYISKYPEALQLAKQYGDHLVEHAIELDKGIGWLQSNRPLGQPLGGLAHGNSGIAYSLFKLYHFSQNPTYLETAQQAILYDNSLFSNDQENWTDLRNIENTNQPLYPVYWCNGAVGVGLSRLYSLDYYTDTVLEQDLKRAIQKTKKAGFDKISHSLCHGDLGNLDFLLSVAIKQNDQELLEIVYNRANILLQHVQFSDQNWKCGIPGSEQSTPNMFTGLAGIGYTMLRLWNREVPSVLILESP
ncbi:type 2 lanthipeptide synthetase LanM family protein [Paenibacillus sp. KACC 21273]|uniref:type 2 lanthipeptide synthetase LanM family protein n=1 Tax=Paenibacillus sp. KACC 21273 TaxID=3025665 RepID=UPI00236642A1|nr:type 2 lanthipeptide synthetase LanM family protein [Paenibacillus sp. KACC 21273]WDF51204.1 type 2 lanthipeptide synthetase LanM family protein [Paenibacillus sp. KACC 21273]